MVDTLERCADAPGQSQKGADEDHQRADQQVQVVAAVEVVVVVVVVAGVVIPFLVIPFLTTLHVWALKGGHLPTNKWRFRGLRVQVCGQ